MTDNIQAKLDYLFGTKAAIKLAIEAKGVSVDEAVTFRQYATKIGDIETSVPQAVEFLVIFIDYDGTIITEELVPYGQAATSPPVPSHEELTFARWNQPFNNVISNLTIGTIYQNDNYYGDQIVHFIDYDGSILKEELVPYGQAATAPQDPSHEELTFAGWNQDFTAVNCYLIVAAIYADITLNSYWVRFVDYDGNLLSSEQVLHGQSAAAPADPIHDVLTFAGWNQLFHYVNCELTIGAVYNTITPDYHTVIFMDYDGTIITEELVPYMQDATPPADPIHEGLTFYGWNQGFSSITSNLTVGTIYYLSI